MTGPATIKHAPRMRRGVRVRGIVQGVGFRPTVFRLASDSGLAGFVQNDVEGVWIEIEGSADQVTRFVETLPRHAPPLSRIDAIETSNLPADGRPGFVIAASGARPSFKVAEVGAVVPVDAATCDDCLAELFDPGDRRHRYPFINCTNCGPRYTIVRDVPYDRARTTMAAFTLCALCRAEYEAPSDRRFHAEPNACPACGPRLRLGELTGEAALAAAVAAVKSEQILALKGLGGFHLVVDATRGAAVDRLRARKHRPHKPLAVMARSLGHADEIVTLDGAARRALTSSARPIVLCQARRDSPIASSVAPGLGELGVMLPYTPLHHLLLADGPPFLVMTSGNRAEEPISRDDGEAQKALAGIADVFLFHDREIHTRADDSVMRIVAGDAQPVRRSRGFVPEGISLCLGPGASRSPPVLAVGAELKNTVCLTRGDQAYLSPHVGDLENPRAHEFFVEVIGKLGRLLGVAPVAVAHDLHPDYRSTRWALDSGLPREAVQHHHAHIASCLADNGRVGPVIGVAFDGTGCGPAGDLWGGEILVADLKTFTRVGHLRPIALPGGEAAIREPWRLAAAALVDAGLPLTPLGRIAKDRLALVAQMVARAPRATGAGRWFDAISALCGVRDVVSYEGQAAVELEAIAAPGEQAAYPVDGFDLRPMVVAIVNDLDGGVDVARIAARFHRTLAEIVVAAAVRARSEHALDCVALSGGCFQNRLLTETVKDLLEAKGFEVLVHRRVPPNDGGVALGQAAIAAHRLAARRSAPEVARIKVKEGSSHVSRNPG